MATPVSREQKQAALARLDRFSRMADNAIGIPFTRFRIGFEPLIGLVPVLGDFAGLIMSCYVLVEAQRAGASSRVKGQMVRNMLIDFFGGLVPVVGDAFDFAWKANARNTKLLRDYLETELQTRPRPPFPWKQLVVIVGILSALTALGVLLLGATA
ncbi:DUF4112 domain-containing protein [Marinobacter orientalis]|uniref:DUF4112 domain-containing protein n=1 Tax=Marinobacter orientalis TaxID=1928859 RepID=A0A7Y0RDZ3_9GAMM|nr:DUF4112 domain-containing protein [Marinobacter orientalis]NMT64477.1 DUF4112 domain-containing protein [Marinobacter orientalis]TGX50564.1 DUF4112 domain-containing protein [Marinobacter orientalis]